MFQLGIISYLLFSSFNQFSSFHHTPIPISSNSVSAFQIDGFTPLSPHWISCSIFIVSFMFSLSAPVRLIASQPICTQNSTMIRAERPAVCNPPLSFSEWNESAANL